MIVSYEKQNQHDGKIKKYRNACSVYENEKRVSQELSSDTQQTKSQMEYRKNMKADYLCHIM